MIQRALSMLLCAGKISLLSPIVFAGNPTPAQVTPAPVNTATPQGKLPAYDVVVIKLNKSGSGNYGVNSTNDRYTASNVSVKRLMQDAYNIKEALISGVTGPIESARFDVTAKIVEPDPDVIKAMSSEQWRSMLLPFLAERFKLKAHTETRTLPVYELVVTKGGPKFKQSGDDGKQGGGTDIENHDLTAHDVDMTSFASTLFDQVHRTVIDKTGLTGRYDLKLKWSPEDSPDTGADTAPSIFTALQEQLGLKLRSAKGPVETLVVDHVEMPSEN